jgi:hypothetical protein
MVTASLPKSKQPTMDNELKRVGAMEILCMDVGCYKLLTLSFHFAVIPCKPH